MVVALSLSASLTLGGVTMVQAQPAPPPAPGAPGVPATPIAPATPPPAPAYVGGPPPPALWSPPETAMASAGPPDPLPAIIMWAVGGASLIVGGAFGIAALSAKSDFDSTPTYGTADKVHSRAVVSDVGLGLGLILVATGTVFYFSGSGGEGAGRVSMATPPATAERKLRVSPFLGSAFGAAHGGGVLTMQF